MDILEIMRSVAERYKIINPAWLEGGYFPASQMKVLIPLFEKWFTSKSDQDGLIYIEQKVKFIVRRGKRSIT